jgi:hypothetical protein
MRFWRTSLEQMRAHARFSRWRQSLAGPRGWLALASIAAVFSLTLASAALAGVWPDSGGPAASLGPRTSAAVSGALVTGVLPGSDSLAAGPAPAQPRHHHAAAQAGHRYAAAQAGHRYAAAQAGPARLRTSCRSVAHIGDSTSVGMISPLVLTDPAQRLAARYADVGVRHLRVDASGGRSIVEILPGQVNGYHVARAWDAGGYHGCWVFALGTNDTANVSVGSDVTRLDRVERMMSAAHGQPVLWVNARTMLSGGPWAQSNMRSWNDTLLRACARHPNMRIFDWAAEANPGWYLTDGIHYTPAGYAVRARAIADALARAFGRDGASRGCVVR